MPEDQIKLIAQELLSAVPADYVPLRAYVYGSRARGDAALHSDLDILIELRRATDREVKNIVREKAWELSLRYEIVVSAIAVAEEEFENGPLAMSGFAQNVRKEGLEIAT